jgi:hypothetical protein
VIIFVPDAQVQARMTTTETRRTAAQCANSEGQRLTPGLPQLRSPAGLSRSQLSRARAPNIGGHNRRLAVMTALQVPPRPILHHLK